MEIPFDHSRYTTIVFMDSMVALEGKPFRTLPWADIDTGAILVLVVPQVCAEIDKRKRDGRLGKRAREFNRMIAPAADMAKPVRICEGSPTVDIGIARTARINWDLLDDLDPEDADAKVIAQILHARDVPDERKTLLSHDTNPIAHASRHGLKSHRLTDGWLMDAEPSPHEKELVRLKGRLRELEASNPDIQVGLTFDVEEPVRVFRIEPLDERERNALARLVVAGKHKVHQSVFPSPLGAASYDDEYDAKYRFYLETQVPYYTAMVHRHFEVHYAQVPFRFTLSNVGYVQAEFVVVNLTAKGGGIHNRFTVYPLFGPKVPRPRKGMFQQIDFLRSDLQPKLRTRHDVDFAVEPDGGKTIELHCDDFRQGREWVFEGIAMLDPANGSPFHIEVTVTAGNMPGRVCERFTLPYHVETASLANLVDIRKKAFKVPIPMEKHFDAAWETKSSKWLNFVDPMGLVEKD